MIEVHKVILITLVSDRSSQSNPRKRKLNTLPFLEDYLLKIFLICDAGRGKVVGRCVMLCWCTKDVERWVFCEHCGDRRGGYLKFKRKVRPKSGSYYELYVTRDFQGPLRAP